MLFKKDFNRNNAQPINLVNRSGVKALLIQSKHDGLINFDCAMKMKTALLKKNNQCELYEVDGRNNTHSFYTAGCFMLKRDKDRTIDKIFNYLNQL